MVFFITYVKVSANIWNAVRRNLRTLLCRCSIIKKWKSLMQVKALRGVCTGIILFVSGKKKTPYVFLNRITSFHMIFFCFVFYFKKKYHFPISATPKMFQEIIYIITFCLRTWFPLMHDDKNKRYGGDLLGRSSQQI